MTMTDFLTHVRSGDLTDVDAAWMCLDRLNPWSPTRAID